MATSKKTTKSHTKKETVTEEQKEVKKDIDQNLDLPQDMEMIGQSLHLDEYNLLWSSVLQMRKRLFIGALVDSFGNVTNAAKKLGIRRRRHYHRMETDEEYKRAVDDIQNVCKDFAETALFKHMAEHYTPVIFYLKTKARDRGYVEKVDFGNIENVTLQFARPESNFIEPENDAWQ